MEENKQAIIEGILFVVGDDGISFEKLSEITEINSIELKPILEKMIKDYANDNNRGIEIVNYGGVYKLVSKSICAIYASKLYESNDVSNYSQAALETLAIIAYKQPITRLQVEDIRGVNCELIIRKLQARDLIREVGRTDSPGRPFLYEVTEKFLDAFKLDSLSSLPKLPDFIDNNNESELFR